MTVEIGPANPAQRAALHHRPGSLVLAALAGPALPMATMTLPLTIFLPAFYATNIGINLAIVGIIFTVVRLGDLVFDPFIGALMDRTRTRWGRFKPWLAAGIPIIMGGAWLLFMARPGDGPAHLAIALIVAYGGYSIVILSQMGIAAGLTADYRERSRVFAWWQVFNMLGVITALVAPSVLGLFFPASPAFTVRVMGLVIIIMTPITVLVALLTVKDHARALTHQKIRLREYLSLFRQPSTRFVLGSVSMTSLGTGISSAVFVFFFAMLKDVNIKQLSLMLTGFFIINVCASPIWAKLGNRIGKHRALALGCLGTVIYQVTVGFMPPGNFLYLGAVFAFGGFCAGTADLFPRAMMADVSDEDRLAAGTDRTGMLYALLSLTTKLGQAIAIGLVYVFLKFIGFDAAAGNHNSPHALLWVLLLGSAVPAMAHFSSTVLAFCYPLTAKRHDAIRAELARLHLPSAADGVPANPLAAEADFTAIQINPIERAENA